MAVTGEAELMANLERLEKTEERKAPPAMGPKSLKND